MWLAKPYQHKSGYQQELGKIRGRGGKIRTCDPLFPKQVRYQAALRPDDGSGLLTPPAKKASGLSAKNALRGLGLKEWMIYLITGANAQLL